MTGSSLLDTTDIYKYATKAKVEFLKKIFENGPRLLGQKFKYVNIDREARSRELSVALTLMVDAGLAYKVTHTSSHGIPLAAQVNPDKFKVYFLDIGLAARLLGLRFGDILIREQKLNHMVKGGLAEQFVAQELMIMTAPNHKPELYYWHREAKSAQAEVDFIFESNGVIYPIEVKGEEGGAMKSLHIFLSEKSKYVSYGVKVSKASWGFHKGVLALPFYAVQELKRRVQAEL